MTYDEAVRAANMFTAAMAEAGYPLEKSAWVDLIGNDWHCKFTSCSAPIEVENKARLLIAYSFGLRTSCTRCWIESDEGRDYDRYAVCLNGSCPYENEEIK